MRSLFVVLLAVNALMFGLGQGWFGGVRPEPGTDAGMLQTQINANALQIAAEPSSQGR